MDVTNFLPENSKLSCPSYIFYAEREAPNMPLCKTRSWRLTALWDNEAREVSLISVSPRKIRSTAVKRGDSQWGWQTITVQFGFNGAWKFLGKNTLFGIQKSFLLYVVSQKTAWASRHIFWFSFLNKTESWLRRSDWWGVKASSNWPNREKQLTVPVLAWSVDIIWFSCSLQLELYFLEVFILQALIVMMIKIWFQLQPYSQCSIFSII